MKINALKLQILMGEQDLSIKSLAEKSEVSRQTISCIKAGKSCMWNYHLLLDGMFRLKKLQVQ